MSKKNKPVPHARQRLSDEQVKGSSDLELAEEYGVHFSWIHKIRRGEVRAEAGGPLRLDPVVRAGSNSPTSILDEKKVRRILSTYSKGKTTYAGLAEIFGVSASTISAICTGRKWRRVFEDFHGTRSV